MALLYPLIDRALQTLDAETAHRLAIRALASGWVGGFIAKLLGLTAFNVIGEVVVATIGAIICLFIWQRIRGT